MTVRIARTWDSIPPVVYDGDEAISTRVLERQHRDLLEALEDLMNDIGGGPKSCGHGFTCVCTTDKASAAIKKARGEA